MVTSFDYIAGLYLRYTELQISGESYKWPLKENYDACVTLTD